MPSMIDYQELANQDISESISNLNVHDHLKGYSVSELRKMCDNDRKPFGVCVLNITGELNVGTIVRTALLTGAQKVGILGRKKFDKRGCVGAYNYINVDRVEGLNDDGITISPVVFWTWILENNYTPIFIEQGGIMLNEIYWDNLITSMSPRLPCLVFGNENRGIQDDILHDSRGLIVSIEQLGVLRSYNVASAAAIVMHNMCSNAGWL